MFSGRKVRWFLAQGNINLLTNINYPFSLLPGDIEELEVREELQLGGKSHYLVV